VVDSTWNDPILNDWTTGLKQATDSCTQLGMGTSEFQIFQIRILKIQILSFDFFRIPGTEIKFLFST